MGANEAGKQSVKLVNNLQDISFLEIGIILLATTLAIWLIRRTVLFLAARGPSKLRLYVLAIVPIARLLLLSVAILWIIPIVFNITLQNFLVIAGAASVAIGFAFKDDVSSLIAGIAAILERPYRPGDWVTIGGDYGEVQSVGMRALRLLTPDANVVTVPHSKLWTDNISNSNDGEHALMCVAHFFLQPRHDAAAIRSVLQDVALTSAYLDYDHDVIVVLVERPWGTHYRIRAYPFDMRDQFAFVSDMTIRGKLAIAEAGALEAGAGTPLGLAVTD